MLHLHQAVSGNYGTHPPPVSHHQPIVNLQQQQQQQQYIQQPHPNPPQQFINCMFSINFAPETASTSSSMCTTLLRQLSFTTINYFTLISKTCISVIILFFSSSGQFVCWCIIEIQTLSPIVGFRHAHQFWVSSSWYPISAVDGLPCISAQEMRTKYLIKKLELA
jgi:hypothetical protein